MAFDAGDLRDRFKRSDYRSAPLRPRPVDNNSLDEVSMPPAQPAPQTRPMSQHINIADDNSVPVSFSKPAQPTPMESRPMASQPAPTQQAPQVETTQQQPAEQPTHEESKIAHPVKAKKEKKSRKSSRKPLLAVAAITLVLAIGAGAWFFFLKSSSPLPKQYSSKSLGFEVYFPKGLPAGYRIAPSSYKSQDGAFVFTIDTADGHSVPVSEQAFPSGSTADTLVPAPPSVKVTGVDNLTFSLGKAALSTWNNNNIVSATAGNTWLILNVGSLSAEDATTILNSFKKV